MPGRTLKEAPHGVLHNLVGVLMHERRISHEQAAMSAVRMTNERV